MRRREGHHPWSVSLPILISAETHVTFDPPSYLRVHRDEAENEDARNPSPESVASLIDPPDHVDDFWRVYTEATGWQVNEDGELQDASAVSPPEPSHRSDTLPNQGTLRHDASEHEVELQTPGNERRLPAVQARRLADAAARLASQLLTQQQSLQAHQAELAVRAVETAPDLPRDAIGQQIGRALGDAVQATESIAAAVYVIDDETEFLHTRFLHGLSPQDRLGKTRPLRGARADLESLVGGVVTIDDVDAGPLNTWNTPEPCRAAICCCVGNQDYPIGTLWLMSDRPRQWQDSDAAAARLAAAHVLECLERHQPSTSMSAVAKQLVVVDTEEALETDWACSDEPTEADLLAIEQSDFVSTLDIAGDIQEPPVESEPQSEFVLDIANWQHSILPVGTRLAPQWYVDGMIESPSLTARSWHHWDVLPDGTLAMAVASTPRRDAVGLMQLTLARSALQAHAGYRHDPSQAIQRVGDTLWHVLGENPLIDDDLGLDLFYMHIQADTGEFVAAQLGNWNTNIVSRFGYRPFQHRVAGPRIGFEPTPIPQVSTAILQPGEALIVRGMSAWTDARPDGVPQAVDADSRFASALKDAMATGETNLLAATRRYFADVPLTGERTAISLRHEAPVHSD
ncbi:MAG: hypothetical protein AAGD07_16700 [Planctomycetota bacterium]